MTIVVSRVFHNIFKTKLVPQGRALGAVLLLLLG